MEAPVAWRVRALGMDKGPAMKAAIVVLLCVPAFVLLAGCAAQVVAPAGHCIAPEVMRQCAVEGGCTLFSHARLLELVREVAEQACRGKV